MSRVRETTAVLAGLFLVASAQHVGARDKLGGSDDRDDPPERSCDPCAKGPDGRWEHSCYQKDDKGREREWVERCTPATRGIAGQEVALTTRGRSLLYGDVEVASCSDIADGSALAPGVASAEQLVSARRHIGFAAAEKSVGTFNTSIDNWQPLSGFTETLCGTLASHELFTGGLVQERKERDQCLYMVPDATHAYLFQIAGGAKDAAYYGMDVVAFFGDLFGGDLPDNDNVWPTCNGTELCVEAEISTPDILDGIWPSPGQQMCVHGPWVQEKAHGYKPEIHPAELSWWTKDLSNVRKCVLHKEHWFAQISDSSSRYDYKGRFDTDHGYVGPWVVWPIRHTVALPFSVPLTLVDGRPRGTEISGFVLDQLRASGVLTEAPGAVVQTVMLDGKTVVEVRKNTRDPRHFRITFAGLCQTKTPWELRGRIEITTGLGVPESYNVFRVTEGLTRGQPEPEPEPPPAELALLPGLRPCIVDGAASKLCGTYRATLFQSPFLRNGTMVEGRVRWGEFLDRPRHFYVRLDNGRVMMPPVRLRYPARSPDPAGPGPSARAGDPEAVEFDFPLTITGRLRLFDLDLDKAVGRTDVAGTALHAFVESTGAVRAATGAGDGAQLLQRVKDLAPTAPAAPKLAELVRWGVHVAPRYVALKRGQPGSVRAKAPEDESPLAARLNALLAGPQAERSAIFGSTPFQITWTIRAFDLDGTDLGGIELRGAPPREKKGAATLSITLSSRAYPDDTLEISFDKAESNIYRVVAVAVVRDSLGNVTRSSSSQDRLGLDPQAAPAVVQAIGRRQRAIFSLLSYVFAPERIRSPVPTYRGLPARFVSAAVGIRTRSHLAAADGLVGLEDLRSIQEALARQSGRPPSP